MRTHVFALAVLTSARLWSQSLEQYAATLTGAQGLPPNDSRFTAQATVLFYGDAIGVEITHEGALMIGEGDAFVQAADGSNLFTIPWTAVKWCAPYPPESPGAVIYLGGFAVSPSQAADLQAGRLFVALSSAQYPNGEIRGRIVPQPSLSSVWGDPVPAGIRLTPNDSVRFYGGSQGYPAPMLQWQFSPDGSSWQDIPGATGANLTLSGVKARDAGYYRMMATNSFGVGTSYPRRLDYILTPAQPFTKLVLIGGGPPSDRYIFYASTNAEARWSNWVPVATNLVGTNMIVDLGPTNAPRRFYRVVLCAPWQ